MWAVEHSVETSARAQAVWRLWADVKRWPEWNAGIERIISGDFPKVLAALCAGWLPFRLLSLELPLTVSLGRRCTPRRNYG
jgi:Polyketide cyclase / dehydrase and lipid transport.